MANILIVEDVEALRQNLKFLLLRCGHTVRDISDGRQVLRLMAQEIPDLLITDLFMPEKDGIEIIQEVHRLYPKVKLMAMSGGISGDHGVFLDMAERLGVDATLSKPFSIQIFQATVERVLAKQS